VSWSVSSSARARIAPRSPRRAHRRVQAGPQRGTEQGTVGLDDRPERGDAPVRLRVCRLDLGRVERAARCEIEGGHPALVAQAFEQIDRVPGDAERGGVRRGRPLLGRRPRSLRRPRGRDAPNGRATAAEPRRQQRRVERRERRGRHAAGHGDLAVVVALRQREIVRDRLAVVGCERDDALERCAAHAADVQVALHGWRCRLLGRQAHGKQRARHEHQVLERAERVDLALGICDPDDALDPCHHVEDVQWIDAEVRDESRVPVDALRFYAEALGDDAAKRRLDVAEPRIVVVRAYGLPAAHATDEARERVAAHVDGRGNAGPPAMGPGHRCLRRDVAVRRTTYAMLRRERLQTCETGGATERAERIADYDRTGTYS
jgi:hypothetical protein